jgi:beta-glucosidase
VAVVGPNADNVRNMLGDYTFPAHVESLLDMKTDNFADTPLPDDLVSLEGELPSMDSVLQGLRKAAPGVEFVYAEGCSVIGGTKDGFQAAIQAATSSDLVIAVMGDKAGLIEGCTSGEARDRASLDLPGHQQDLLRELVATGKPVVLVLVSGRPMTLTWEDEHVAALVEAWLPGEEGAAAIASVLYGHVSPAGRTPMSFPRSVGQIPVFYGHKPSGGRSHWKGNYVDESTKPLYPFGHGLSYSTFTYGNFAVPKDIEIGKTFEVSFTVTNSGTRHSDEVPQLYIRDLLADITRPVQELMGFARIPLSPGQTKRVTFRLAAEQLGFYDRAMKYVVEPGEVEIQVGSSSQDIRLTAVCILVGQRQEFLREQYGTQVSFTETAG